MFVEVKASLEKLKSASCKNIPNILTLGNLMLGMLAIIYTMEGRAQTAISLVFIAMLLDGLDGKLALRLNAGSELGKQLDSLADLVSFGVAPAVLLYSLSLQHFALTGLFVALLFPVAGAYRLARFNLRGKKETVFLGLPITIAGGALVSMGYYTEIISGWPAISLTLLLTVFMISRIPYPSLKGRQHEISFPAFMLFYGAIIVFILFLFVWREAIFYLLFAYVSTGPLATFYRLIGRFLRKQRRFAELPWINRG